MKKFAAGTAGIVTVEAASCYFPSCCRTCGVRVGLEEKAPTNFKPRNKMGPFSGLWPYNENSLRWSDHVKAAGVLV